MPPQDRIENLNEGDKSISRDRPGDSLGETRTVDGKAVQQVQKKNRDMCTSMTDIPDWGTIGKAASNGGFCLTDGDQVIASKNVKEPNIYDASDQDHLLGGKETTFLGQKAIERNGTTYLDAYASNVPEVSQGVQSIQDLSNLSDGVRQGLEDAAIRQPLQFLSQLDAVNNALMSCAGALDTAVDYYTKTPMDKVLSDAGNALQYVGQAIEDTLGHPMQPKERGEKSGEAMAMMLPWGIRNAEVSEKLPKLLATAEGVSPSFAARLENSIEQLPPGLHSAMESEGQKVIGVRRLSDVPELAGTDDTVLYARGKYQDGKFFVAEESMTTEGNWVKNESPEGTARHEIGHFVNMRAGEQGFLASDLTEFVTAYNQDVALMSDELRAKLQPLVTGTGRARDEVFSEIFALSTGGPANAQFARELEQAFPNVMKVMGIGR